jgi:hypothetical protein
LPEGVASSKAAAVAPDSVRGALRQACVRGVLERDQRAGVEAQVHAVGQAQGDPAALAGAQARSGTQRAGCRERAPAPVARVLLDLADDARDRGHDGVGRRVGGSCDPDRDRGHRHAGGRGPAGELAAAPAGGHRGAPLRFDRGTHAGHGLRRGPAARARGGQQGGEVRVVPFVDA